ncbi:MAG: hypothetical protein HXS51_00075 [Theionarchaea archaeon]|nr:hypothetical protein [Theionarchaea archaeon]
MTAGSAGAHCPSDRMSGSACKLVTALGAPNQTTLARRFRAASATGHSRIRLAESISTFRALYNVSEFHVHALCS